jgi:diguanylate cyclase (GGDEF)-like protein/PAS domain S-box-containing protein
VTPVFDSDGGCSGFATLMLDMTGAHLAFKELSDRERNLRSVLDGVHDYAIVSLAANGAVTSWNAGAQNIFGYTALEIMGVNFSVLYPAEDVRTGAPAAELLAATVSGSTQSEQTLVRKDGTPFLASGRLRALERDRGGEVRGFVNVLSDITERAAANLDLQRRADCDELTQLPNRRIFYENVRGAIVSIRRRSTDLFAVLFIDIDHFKRLNDALGHIIADRLLTEIARRLEHCVRAADTVARLGGDEFGVLIAGIRDISDAHDTAGRIEAEMRGPLTIEGKIIVFSVSIGIALGKPGYERPEDILHDADTAMYEAKRSGRGRSAVFRS